MTMLEASPAHPSVGHDDAQVEGLERYAASWLLTYASERTRTEYARDLRQWLTFCAEQGIDPMGAGRTELEAWARVMSLRGGAASSIKRRLIAVRQWYDHLVHDLEVLDRNPGKRVKTPTVHRIPRYQMFSLDQVHALLALAEAEGPRWELAFRLMAANGMRISEVALLTRDRLQYAPDGTLVLNIVGKGNKPRLTVLTGRSADIVRSTLDAYDRSIIGRRLSEVKPLGPLTPHEDAIRRALIRWRKAAGIESVVTPHSLRHWAVTELLNRGISLRDTQDFAGHADPRTTRAYDRDAHSIARHPARTLAAALDDKEPTT